MELMDKKKVQNVINYISGKPFQTDTLITDIDAILSMDDPNLQNELMFYYSFFKDRIKKDLTTFINNMYMDDYEEYKRICMYYTFPFRNSISAYADARILSIMEGPFVQSIYNNTYLKKTDEDKTRDYITLVCALTTKLELPVKEDFYNNLIKLAITGGINKKYYVHLDNMKTARNVGRMTGLDYPETIPQAKEVFKKCFKDNNYNKYLNYAQSCYGELLALDYLSTLYDGDEYEHCLLPKTVGDGFGYDICIRNRNTGYLYIYEVKTHYNETEYEQNKLSPNEAYVENQSRFPNSGYNYYLFKILVNTIDFGVIKMDIRSNAAPKWSREVVENNVIVLPPSK